MKELRADHLAEPWSKQLQPLSILHIPGMCTHIHIHTYADPEKVFSVYFQAKGTTARDQERVQAATSGDSSPLRKFPSKKRKKDKDSLMEGFSTMADLVNSQDADRGDTVRKSFSLCLMRSCCVVRSCDECAGWVGKVVNSDC